MDWTIKAFDQNSKLAEQLAQTIADQLRHSIKHRGSASLAVSGGSTPKAFFECLSRQDVAWQYVWVTLVDERWVDTEHADSNERLVRQTLLQNRASDAHFVGLKTDSPCVGEGAQVAGERLKGLAMPFDAVVLGMGLDGHTASFFAGAPTLDKALNPPVGVRCIEIQPPTAQHDRLTLVLPALLNTKVLIIHIVGQEKWDVLQSAMLPGDVEQLPVRAVLNQQQAPVTIYYAAQD